MVGSEMAMVAGVDCCRPDKVESMDGTLGEMSLDSKEEVELLAWLRRAVSGFKALEMSFRIERNAFRNGEGRVVGRTVAGVLPAAKRCTGETTAFVSYLAGVTGDA